MADTKISALTAVTTPADTDEIPVNQGGTSKKETRAQILTDAVAHNSFGMDGIITTSLAGNNHNWAPAGLASASVIRFTCSSNTTLDGLTGGVSGRVITLANIGTVDLVLYLNSNNSLGTNRFLAAGTQSGIPANGAMVIWYDAAVTSWRIVGTPTYLRAETGNVSLESVSGAVSVYAGTTLQLAGGATNVFTADSTGISITPGGVASSAGQILTSLGPSAAWSPTSPTVRAVSAEAHGTGTASLTLPAGHTTNDIIILAIQTSNESIATPAGYTQIGPENGLGINVTAGATRLGLFWARDNGAMTDPLTIADSGDHTYATAIAITGCPKVGDPFHFLGNSAKFATATAAASVATRTTIDQCLILDFFAHHLSATGAQMSGFATNASLQSRATQFDGSTTDGTGGGIVIISGVKFVAGTVNATTFNWGTTTADLHTVIAMIPADAYHAMSSPPPTDVQTFIGSASDLDDTWTKPFTARRVFVQICDGGGSGSGGNITTTAEGGGGGGGGGYDEAWFNADQLAATIAVHPGKGGAVGTALNQAGAVGVVSEFDKGGRGPLISAYRFTQLAATAAASAVSGAGGSGSGRGLSARAVGARIDLSAATAGVALGGTGGRGGGPGGTAPVGGSPAEWGGGGGESGGDTDAAITSANNGWSTRGAGGGSSGRTNTNISGSGAGGGAPGVINAQGGVGTDSTHWPYGASGGIGGGSSTVTGGAGGFPGGGGGGGAGVAGGFGGRGGHGCVVVTTFF